MKDKVSLRQKLSLEKKKRNKMEMGCSKELINNIRMIRREREGKGHEKEKA